MVKCSSEIGSGTVPLEENYNFGGTVFPYSTDQNLNPLTLKQVDLDQFDLDLEAIPWNPALPRPDPRCLRFGPWHESTG
jgi:hypothetical protein